MGLDIGGNVIIKNGLNGITLNSLVFNSAGQGSGGSPVGYAGYKSGGATYYAATSGWESSAFQWRGTGMHPTNGGFTCPVAGLYAMGYNGIHRGGSGVPAGFNTYGYGGFAKNGVLTYFVHWNSGAAPNYSWESGGQSVLFNCAAGDYLALFINRAPSQVAADSQSQNYGLYPNAHHAVWCKLVG